MHFIFFISYIFPQYKIFNAQPFILHFLYKHFTLSLTKVLE